MITERKRIGVDFEAFGLSRARIKRGIVEGHESFNDTTKEYEGDFCQLWPIGDEEILNGKMRLLQQRIDDNAIEGDSIEIISDDSQEFTDLVLAIKTAKEAHKLAQA